ncbi:MAG TPA: class I SAM-dependent methyltransferase [Victivallales bacterium]|nr:class I SAM-dependent methyltransferase [Victivallales bacterium]
MDLSREMLEVAQRKLLDSGAKLKVVEMVYSVTEGAFDLILF